VAEIIVNINFLSLCWNPASYSLSSIKKELEKKIKFGIKIKFFKIRGTGYLIAEKDGGLK
jgi:hypothetical protein